jgi:beta-lactamase class A
VRIYFDSSALIKRSVQEAESDAVEAAFDRYVGQDAVIVSSSLAWIEVSRALRTRLDGGAYAQDDILDAVEGALSGVAERVITEEVISLARRVAPPRLRSLDAIHLATAILLDADEIVAYDDRLIDACRHNGLVTVTPGRPRARTGRQRSGSTATNVSNVFDQLGVNGAAYAAPVAGGSGQGAHADDLMTPASVMKVQVALAVENAITAGAIDGETRLALRSQSRTPGPVGLSLMQDEVSMSVRDLVIAMLTVSDNVATDELIATIGLDQINDITRRLGMTRTKVADNLRDMLDGIASDAGFDDYRSLTIHDPAAGPPSEQEVRHRIAASAALDPNRGSRTTAKETVTLLQTIWTDRAGPPQACATVRSAMAHQLTQHRIASGFTAPVTVAAKSGGLMGIVRNEAGVVTFPDGNAYAVAVFTRSEPGATNAMEIDAGIGIIARLLVDQLRADAAVATL